MSRIALGLAVVLSVLCGSAAAQQRTRRASASGAAPVTSTSYNAAWTRIQDCADFKRKLWLLPQADTLLRQAAASGAAEKSEFESVAEYQDRVRRELSAYLTADKVYLIHPLKDNWSSYNAERQELTVEFPAYTRSGYIPVGFSLSSRVANGTTYRGTNAFGVSRTIQKQTRIADSVDYTFPTSVTDSPIIFPMNGSDAEMFKMGIGVMHILGEIIKTNVRRVTSTPTLQRPVETRVTQFETTMRPRCAYITFGPELVESWGYEAW